VSALNARQGYLDGEFGSAAIPAMPICSFCAAPFINPAIAAEVMQHVASAPSRKDSKE
jgi:hypothetical protein